MIDHEIETALAEKTAQLDQRGDVFTAGFLRRVPKEVGASFTDEQLRAIKMAFGARARGAHPVDIRLNLDLLFWRGYLVLLAGGEQRSRARLEAEKGLRPLFTFANALFALLILSLSVLGGLVFLYILKSALGIDLISGVSLGLWSTLQEQWRALTF